MPFEPLNNYGSVKHRPFTQEDFEMKLLPEVLTAATGGVPGGVGVGNLSPVKQQECTIPLHIFRGTALWKLLSAACFFQCLFWKTFCFDFVF